MKILITGANGFLGYYLTDQLLQKGKTVMATGIGSCRLPYSGERNFHYQEMDFTNPYSVHDVFETFRPEVVVHAGAMSQPDKCEFNQMAAYLVNVEGTVQLLMNAQEHKSFFLFLSTDFVFDGETGMYRETDAPRPVNYYGRTKLEAEEAVKEYEYDWAIARTVLVYGKNHSGRKNLLHIVKEKLEQGEVFHVVNDQLRTPTYVEDLAKGIMAIIEQRAKGIFHLSGREVLTPYQMAQKAAVHLGLDTSLLHPVTAATFTQPAKRPLRTGFMIDKARIELGFVPVSFEEGLTKTFR